MNHLLQQLEGGDRRSIGAVPEIVNRVLRDLHQLPLLLEGLWDASPLVRMRSADAVEKITAVHPQTLRPHKKRLIDLAAAAEQPELRWHLAQLLARLSLSKPERRRVIEIMNRYLTDRSSIVKTFSMQTLADIASVDPDLRGSIVTQLHELVQTGTPAMQSRGRRLLAGLDAC